MVMTMRIWIDLSNAPHAQFFSTFIEDLRRSENEILVTARKFDHLIGILNDKGIDHKVVGKHGGATLEGKLKASSERIHELTDIVSNFEPDISISKHSVEAPRVAFGLDIPTITVADNEHATAQNKLIFPLADKIITPSSIPKKTLVKQGANEESIVTYNGFSEIAHVDNFKPNSKVLEKLSLNPEKPIIVMRTVPIKANYYEENNGSMVYDIIPELNKKSDSQIVLFPRSEDQKKRLSKFDVIIPENTIDSLSLLNYSDLMIGAGGTMNRESIAIGTPAISTYPQELLSVTRYLIEKDLLVHTTKTESTLKETKKLLKTNKNYKNKLKECINPTNIITRTIEDITGKGVLKTSNVTTKEETIKEKA